MPFIKLTAKQQVITTLEVLILFAIGVVLMLIYY